MSGMIYTIKQIAEYVKPVAEKYELPAVYVFGSYARGEASGKSDIDLLVEIRGSLVRGMVFGGLYNDLKEALPIDFDVLTMGALESPRMLRDFSMTPTQIKKDMIKIYERNQPKRERVS
jgi:predicted nucleotidyltransferase